MAANQEYERLRTENEKTKQNFMKRLKEKEKEGVAGYACVVLMAEWVVWCTLSCDMVSLWFWSSCGSWCLCDRADLVV